MGTHPTRYHGALVVLHWLLAVLLIVALAMGTFALKPVPNSSSDKIFALQGHMIAGGLILLLTLTRLVVRLKTAHPAPATTGNALLDRLAPLTHWALYGLGSLPVNFDALPPRAVHGIVAKLLMLAIGLHIAAALYHQFVRRDGLLSRMGFGAR
jgi:cytochrome b561